MNRVDKNMYMLTILIFSDRGVRPFSAVGLMQPVRRAHTTDCCCGYLKKYIIADEYR